jgi:hypothetical protein
MLASLSSREANDLAGVSLDHDQRAVLEAACLDLLNTSGTGISLLELIVLFHISFYNLISIYYIKMVVPTI